MTKKTPANWSHFGRRKGDIDHKAIVRHARQVIKQDELDKRDKCQSDRLSKDKPKKS